MTTFHRRHLAHGLGALGLAAGAVALSAGAARAQPAPAAPNRSDVSRTQQRLTAAESFVPMPRLAAPVLNAGYRSTGTLVAEVCLDVPDRDLRSRANGLRPRLRDAMRQTFMTYASTRIRPGGAPDADQLARMLQRSVDQALGGQGARLLLVDLMLQAG